MRENTYALPISQTDLADASGITVVHTNRMLATLRAQGLIEFNRHDLLVRDVEGLKAKSGFDPNYLHLE